jgi:RHS repeat-associated protein
MYNPSLGTFDQRDPIGYGTVDPSLARYVPSSLLAGLHLPEPEFNLYAYVGDNPLTYTDPSGKVKIACGFPSNSGFLPSGPGSSIDLGPKVPGVSVTATVSISNCSAAKGIPVLKIPLTPGGCAGVSDDALRGAVDLVGSHYSAKCEASSNGCSAGQTVCPLFEIKTETTIILPMPIPVPLPPARPTCLSIVVTSCTMEKSISVGRCVNAAPPPPPKPGGPPTKDPFQP